MVLLHGFHPIHTTSCDVVTLSSIGDIPMHVEVLKHHAHDWNDESVGSSCTAIHDFISVARLSQLSPYGSLLEPVELLLLLMLRAVPTGDNDDTAVMNMSNTNTSARTMLQTTNISKAMVSAIDRLIRTGVAMIVMPRWDLVIHMMLIKRQQ